MLLIKLIYYFLYLLCFLLYLYYFLCLFPYRRVLSAMDDVYYRLYYCVDLTWRTKRLAHCPVPGPHLYFGAHTADEAALNAELKAYIEGSLSAAGKKTFARVFGLADRLPPFQDNPLLALHFSRWRESVCLFHNHVSDKQRICRDPSLLPACCTPAPPDPAAHASMKPRGDPLVPPLVREWNDASRTWPCHLYAYATPSPQALDTLGRYAPLLELGAGTGYWASALRKRHPGLVLSAYDKDPPGFGKDTRSNAYHGRAAAWTAVLKGGVEVIARHPKATLFLCYPPPDSDMALQALRAYQGQYLCYCGEYRGDTGTKAFEQLLEQTFDCVQRDPLPNWVDTCYSLTVWRRRGPGNGAGGGTCISSSNSTSGSRTSTHSSNSSSQHPLRCVGCGALRPAVLRCRVTYSVCVCSEACAAASRQAHTDELAFRYSIV
jgi:hypothetical protein